jgi:hypothetical protein
MSGQPRTWLPSDQVTHTAFNTEVRDALNAAYGAPAMELSQSTTYGSTTASGVAATVASFNTKYFDASSDGSVMLSGSAPWTYMTVMVPGTYMILAQTSFAQASGTGQYYVGAYVDQALAFGATLPDTARIGYEIINRDRNLNSPAYVSLELEYPLGAGNTLQLGIWQDTGAALNINPGADRFYFQMFRLSD